MKIIDEQRMGNAMNHRHPTNEERKALTDLLDEVGSVEVLRVVGQFIAHNHEDWAKGDKFRTDINKLANEIKESLPCSL